MIELQEAPTGDFQNIPVAVIYPNEGIDYTMVKGDANGEWSRTLLTGKGLGHLDCSPVPRGTRARLERLGWTVIVDKD